MARIDIDQNATLTNNVEVNANAPSLCANTTVTNESSASVTVVIPPTPPVPPAPIKKSQPDRNYDSLDIGSDSAIAINNAMGPRLRTLAENNLEIKKSQDSGECKCCPGCGDCCTQYNWDEITVGNRGAVAFGSASSSNNVRVVAVQE